MHHEKNAKNMGHGAARNLRESAYEDKAEAELTKLGSKIDKLQAMAEKAKAGAKLELSRSIEEISKRRQALGDKLSQWRESGSEVSSQMKDEIKDALKDLKNGISSAMSRFKS